MAFRIRKPSQESFFALNAIPLYSYAIPLPREAGMGERGGIRRAATFRFQLWPKPGMIAIA